MITSDAFTMAVIWPPPASPKSSTATTVRMRPSGARHGVHRPDVSQQLHGRERAESPRPTQFATVNKRRPGTVAGCLRFLRLKLAGHVGLKDRRPRAFHVSGEKPARLRPAVRAGRSVTSGTRASGDGEPSEVRLCLPATGADPTRDALRTIIIPPRVKRPSIYSPTPPALPPDMIPCVNRRGVEA